MSRVGALRGSTMASEDAARLADALADSSLAHVLEIIEDVGRCLWCGLPDHAGRSCCPDCQHPHPWAAET